MARQNEKISSKYYDTLQVGDWNLKFEYETENDVLTGKIQVTGNKGSSSVYISKSNNQVQTIFSNGEYAADVASAVIAEFQAIEAEFAPVPIEPIEGE